MDNLTTFETIFILCSCLGCYGFGLFSGVAMQRKSNKDSERFRKELLSMQAETLRKTRKNKADYYAEPHTVCKTPFGFGTWTKTMDDEDTSTKL
jgi:hypothetical protein